MKLIRLFVLALGFALWTHGLDAQTNAPGTLPAYLVKFAAERIRTDGKLDEAAWAAAPWSSDFVWIDVGGAAPVKTRFKAVYNSDGLHFALEAEAVRGPGQPLDPDFPYAIGIFLDPEGRGRRYLEYSASPDGVEHVVTWIGQPSMAQWKGEAGISSHVGMSRLAIDSKRETLIYEVTFPWNGMGNLTGKHRFPPVRGEAWRANFSRAEAGEFRGDYSWAPTGGVDSMRNPGCFGWLVFSGETDPLRDASAVALKPLEDVSLRINGSRRFPLFSRTLWPKWVTQSKADGGFFVVGKTYVARLDAKGQTDWRVTRTEGLPQFVTSAALVGDNLYLAGTGANAGLVAVDGGGRLNRNAKGESYVLDLAASLTSLNPQLAIAVSGDRYQLIRTDGIAAPVKANGTVQCAAAFGNDLIVIGTPIGFEIYDGKGKSLQRAAVTGGITSVAVVGDAVVGTSGKNGLYRITSEGACTYYPRPLRTKFDRVYADSRGRCWATYVGGVALVAGDKVQHFTEPLGLSSFQVFDAAATGDGKMVFAASQPNGTWYSSFANSPFLLVSDGRHWSKYSLRTGLPAQLESVDSSGGDVFISTSAGVFRFRR